MNTARAKMEYKINKQEEEIRKKQRVSMSVSEGKRGDNAQRGEGKGE